MQESIATPVNSDHSVEREVTKTIIIINMLFALTQLVPCFFQLYIMVDTEAFKNTPELWSVMEWLNIWSQSYSFCNALIFMARNRKIRQFYWERIRKCFPNSIQEEAGNEAT